MTDVSKLNECREQFKAAFEEAANLSIFLAGRFVHPRFGWATWIFSRTCQHGLSIAFLLEAYLDHQRHSTVDHIAIVNLCRLIIEESVLISYLAEEGISDEEWTLRKRVLDLHDCQTRIRLFRGLGNETEAAAFRKILDELKERLRAEPAFRALPEDKQKRLLSGQQIYAHGLRNAAFAAGWDEELFDGLYAYLSGAVHSAPTSFYRYEEQKIDNMSVTDAQRGQLVLALHLARAAVEQIMETMRRPFPDVDPITAPADTPPAP